MKQIVLSVFSILTIGTTFSQITLIPDPNFEQVLVDQGKDFDGVVNGQMTTSDVIGIYNLEIPNANISDLTGIEAFVNIITLNASQNQISTIDLSQNTNLTYINLYSNQLTSFNFPQLTSLTEISLQNNPLTNIDVSGNLALTNIIISDALITTIDLTQNSNLVAVSLFSSMLESIDIRNGNNGGINYFSATSNPNLTCIFVDDASSSYLSSWSSGAAQFVNNQVACDALQNPLLIPDSNFEQALIDLGIDSDNTINGQMSSLDALNVGSLNITNENISDLTGIEGFTSLTELLVSQNNLSNINVLSLPNLVTLNVSENNLATLNVSNNLALLILICNNNNLSTIDLSMLPDLKNFNIGGNQLNAIDVTNNSKLQYLNVTNNSINALNLTSNLRLKSLISNFCNLSTLDLSNNDSLITLNATNNSLSALNTDNLTFLEVLACGNNQLSQLNLLNNASLELLSCENNQISSLDVSTLVNLTTAYLQENMISAINVSSNQQLIALYCQQNNLSELDISNNSLLTILFAGNNNNLNWIDFRNGNNTNVTNVFAQNNPNLTCFYVDDKNASYLNTWTVDVTTTFVESTAECLALSGILSIPDSNFEQELIDLGIDTDGTINQQMSLPNTVGVTTLELQGLSIADMTGIEGFLDLITLDCSNNQIESLDLSSNTNLVSLNASNNNLSYLDLRNTNNTNMTTVDFSSNANLTCVFVDDKNASILSTWNASQNSSYVNDEAQCSSLGLSNNALINAVYPNPVIDILMISVEAPVDFEIVSLDGKIINSGNLISGSNLIDLSSVPSGMYVLKTNFNNSIKIIKQ